MTDESHGSLRAIGRALRLTSIGTLLTIVFGIGTNKIIAVVAGPLGVALIGVYRTVVSIVTSVVQLGVNDGAIQRLSTARGEAEVRQTIGAATALTILQSAAVLVVAVVAARPLAVAIFGADAAAHVWELRVVLATTTGVLALQTATTLLNGQARVAEATRVGVATSAATFATVYPLLLLGNIGFGLIIGATCFVGAALGLYYVVRAHRLRARELLFLGRWRDIPRVLPFSTALVVEPVVVTGSALVVQSILARDYGTDALGFFNGASLIESVAVMVLTSSMRSYFMPTLGRFEREDDKAAFLNRMLTLLILLVLGGVTLLAFVAPLAMRILFSSRFVGASRLATILAVSIVGQGFAWCYAMYFLHRAQFATRLALEVIWAAVRVGGTWWCAARGLPLEDVAWIYVAAYTLLGAMHSTVAVLREGRRMLAPRNLALGVGGVAALVALVLERR